MAADGAAAAKLGMGDGAAVMKIGLVDWDLIIAFIKCGGKCGR